jgi:hypothetical protein
VQLALLVAADHDGLATDVGGEVVPVVRNLALVREVDPVAFEDVLHLQLEDFLVGEDVAAHLVSAAGRIFDESAVEGGAHMVQGLGHGDPPERVSGRPRRRMGLFPRYLHHATMWPQSHQANA